MTIVTSILLALAVQAWWEAREERRTLAAYEELLSIQMAANAEMLREDLEGSESARAALGAAVRAISPSPAQISSDSLWALLRSGWGMLDNELETSALESLLGLRTFELLEHPVLYRQMVRFRSESGRLVRNVERFVDVKARTLDYLSAVSPTPTLLFGDPDPDSGFPVPIDHLLRDPRLEALVRDLYTRQSIRRQWATSLLALAVSLATAVPTQH